MSNDFQVPKPDPRVFKRQSLPDTNAQILEQPTNVFMVKTIEYTKDKGTLLHYYDLPYPQKGFPYPEVIWAMNGVKKHILGHIRVLSGARYVLWPFLLVGRKRQISFITSVLESIAHEGDYLFDRFYIRPELYCPAATVTAEWAYQFLVNLGISQELSGRIAQIVAMIMEYDNAYRYRWQDVVEVTSTELLKENPRREVLKMLDAIIKREPSWINHEKFNALGWVLSLILLVPSIKRAFKSSVPNVELIKPDEADKYHCLFRSDYDYQGLPFETRWKMLMDIHGGKVPTPYTVQSQTGSGTINLEPAGSQSQK